MVLKSIMGATCTCILLLSFNVNAGPISNGYVDSGNYTTSSTGLEWLDLSFTDNVAYNNAVTVASTVEGGNWRYASSDEIETLFNDFFPACTIMSCYGESNQAMHDDTWHFLNTFGSTYYSSAFAGSLVEGLGLYMDFSSDLRYFGASDAHFFGIGTTKVWGTGSGTGPDDPNVAFANRGTYLVRATITSAPEPSIAILMVSGLIAFGLVRRKKGT